MWLFHLLVFLQPWGIGNSREAMTFRTVDGYTIRQDFVLRIPE